ncbi:MAG TPA: hypothetical protein VEU74_08820 [Gemmatimonadales bacterium]|nr:hypothetical protein [Gemmatimonadales bacterium]
MTALLRRLRRAPEQALHQLRRRRARAALRARPAARLLVVCHGNQCRSPFAAALLARALASRGVQVESGGFVSPGRAPPPEAVAAAARRGVDLSHHRSRVLTAAVVRAVDLIVVMDAGQRRAVCDRFGCLPHRVIVLGDLDPREIEQRAIPDPIHRDAAAFEESYARIERCMAELTRALDPPRTASRA